MKTASGAMFSFASDAALDKDAFESITPEMVSLVRSIIVEFSHGNVAKEDLEPVSPELDEQSRAAIEQWMSQISQSLIDVSTVANLLVPEINSPGVTKSLATEEEIKTTATKYLDKMCFTVLTPLAPTHCGSTQSWLCSRFSLQRSVYGGGYKPGVSLSSDCYKIAHYPAHFHSRDCVETSRQF